MHPCKSVGLADVRTPAPELRKGKPLHLGESTIHLRVRQSTRHHNIAFPNKLEGLLAQLLQLAKGDSLSTQGLRYFMEAVLNPASGYQALHLPDLQGAPHHARQQVTKAWAQHGGWPMSFPKEAVMAHAAHLLPRRHITTNPRSARQQPYASKNRKRPATPALFGY